MLCYAMLGYAMLWRAGYAGDGDMPAEGARASRAAGAGSEAVSIVIAIHNSYYDWCLLLCVIIICI